MRELYEIFVDFLKSIYLICKSILKSIDFICFVRNIVLTLNLL